MAESSNKLKDLKVASWNVNKPGYGVEKLIGILNTLSKYNVDVALLQETKIMDKFTEQYKEYTLFFPENEKKDLRSFHGVAVAVKNELKSYFQAIPVSDRIMHCILRYGNICLHFINVYAPTKYECAFYEHLQKVFEDIKKQQQCIFLFGDFNAHVGPDLTARACLGQYCVYNEPNTNGKELIRFCEKNDLVIFNTFVKGKRDEKMTYHKEQTEVDLLVTQNEAFMWIKDLRVYEEPEHSDHCIVVSTFKTPSTMTVDIPKFVSLLSNKYIIGSETEKLDESSAWIIIRNLIANLYDFYRSFEYNSNKVFSEATNAMSELQVAYESFTNTYSERLEAEAKSQVQVKLTNALSHIKDYLLSLKKYGLQITGTENEVQNIELVLQEIFSTKQKIKVDIKGSKFPLNWDKFQKEPKKVKIKHALEKIEDAKKYSFLEDEIHSLVKDIWEKGHVPIELTLCIAGVFNSDGEPKGNNVVEFIYDVIQHILNEKLQMQARLYMKKHERYTFSLSNKKPPSVKKFRAKISLLGTNLCMAFIDFIDFKDKNITQTLLHFIRSSGIPNHMFELISCFAIGLRDTNGVSLAKCLLNVSVSILCHNMFEQFKEKSGRMQRGLNVRVVHCNDRMILISSSDERISTCLDTLDDLNKFMGLTILTPIKEHYVVKTDEECINLFSSITLAENNSDSPGV